MVTIPTLNQLYTSIKSDLETEFGSNIPTFGKNFLRVLAMVLAGILKMFYLAIANVQKNIFIDTADPENSGGTLERFGRIKLGRNPFPAQAGQYVVTVTGTVGAVIDGSITFKSNDDSLNPGKLFILDTAHTLISTSDSITLRALEAGIDSKLLVADQLTATAPIANVDKTAVVSSESIPPLAAEDLEAYRISGLDAFRLEPQGGAAADYRLWSKDAQGVAQSYAYARSGAEGETNLYVEATLADSTDGKGTPSGTLLTAVQAVVEFDPDTSKPLTERGRRPIQVIVHYLPVTIKQVDINISGFVGITAPLQSSIFNAMKAYLATVRPFVAGADVIDDKNNVFDTNAIIAIILNVKPGSVFGTIDLKINSVSVSTWTFLNGDIAYLNAINYL